VKGILFFTADESINLIPRQTSKPAKHEVGMEYKFGE
jgi:hypothetical protein